jgi:ankyrin repeat protein
MKSLLPLIAVLCAAPTLNAAAPGDDAALLAAARSGDTAALATQLRAGANANAAEPDGTRALHYAAERGDARAVQLLLAAHADPRAITELQAMPLQQACYGGSAEVVKLLVRAGADVRASDLAGETMLMACARGGSAEAVRLLLRAGAEKDAVDRNFGQTALIFAAREGNEAVVRELIASGANVMARTQVGPVPAFRPNGGTQGKGVEKAPKRGMRAAIPGGKTALHYAARDGHLSTVQALLDAGAVLDDRDPNGITPLLYAASNDRVEVARLLVGRGADVNAVDWYGRSALWCAIDVRNRDTPQPAMGPGTDRDGNFALAQLLLEKKADPNTRIREMPVVRTHIMPLGSLSWVDFTGETPFIRASLAGDVRMMRLLMQHGADPKIATTGGTTALAAAAGVNWVVAQTYDEGPEALLEAVRICHDAGVDVNAANSKGIRAIHGAANRGSDAIVSFLAEHGADIQAKDGEGRSALDWANGVFLATHPAVPRPTTIALLQKLLAAN